MRIARVRTADGHVCHARLGDQGDAYPLTEGLFDDPQFTSDSVAVDALLAPLDPPNIFAIGRNYRKHVAETGAQLPDRPLVFMKPTTALADPESAIELPAGAGEEVDFEAELAIVIGRTARYVSAGDALDYVFGYTCANDVSARDCQRNDKQWTRAKGFDTFCPLGPWIVTADQLDPDDCDIHSRLNGEKMQSARTSEMIHSSGQLVGYLSDQFTLLPGTVILTGTPQGVGMARTPPRFLRDGDRIEVEIGGIGVLRNTVRAVGIGSF